MRTLDQIQDTWTIYLTHTSEDLSEFACDYFIYYNTYRAISNSYYMEENRAYTEIIDGTYYWL